LPSTVRAIACLPPEWTATFLTTYWDRADIWRGADTLLLWDKPKRPLVPSPQACTLPSWVTMNRDFDPPAIQIGLRLPKVSLKIGNLILEPWKKNQKMGTLMLQNNFQKNIYKKDFSIVIKWCKIRKIHISFLIC
jgi:hypothetical protein